MTTHYNHNRRHSSVTPYTIPNRHPKQREGHGPLSPPPRTHFSELEAPQLSREFVVRRISEGETGRLKEQLKCEACGKGYKHVSSLAKHLWEHTPEWNVTKRLLILKHQLVQLLEAASILVGMNENGEKSARAPRRHSAFAREKPLLGPKSRQGSVSQDPPSGPGGQSGDLRLRQMPGGFLDALHLRRESAAIGSGLKLPTGGEDTAVRSDLELPEAEDQH